jgi:FKBP-type peptidyl-prolyl cis-trans isomerase
MKIQLYSVMLLLTSAAVFTGCSRKAEDTGRIALKTKMDTISYIIGLDYGQGIRERNISANPLMVYKGVDDGLKGKSLLSDSLKNKLIDAFNMELQARQDTENARIAAENKIRGKKFLEENLKGKGVVVLPSGLQYKMLKEGAGKSPLPTDSVRVHYRAMFIDRTTFDMSYDSGPVGIRLNHVIKGLSEGIQLMKPGAIYELYIPSELGYGDKDFANVIPGGSTLIYSIELIEVIQ